MKFKELIKSYKFWISLTAIFLFIIEVLNRNYDFEIKNDIVISVAVVVIAILSLFGILDKKFDNIHDIERNVSEDIEKDKDKE